MMCDTEGLVRPKASVLVIELVVLCKKGRIDTPFEA